MGIKVPIVMKNNIIPLLSRVARLFTGGSWLPGKELPFNGASFTTNMKDVEGRAQDKTRLIPTLNNGCYEIFVFPSRCFFISSAGVKLHGPIVCGSLCSPWPLLLLMQQPIYGVTTKNVLPAEDPQGTQPGLRLVHGPFTHPCDFPGAGSPKKHPQGPSDTGMASGSVASGNTPCNCSLLLPSKSVLFFKPAEGKVRIWGR